MSVLHKFTRISARVFAPGHRNEGAENDTPAQRKYTPVPGPNFPNMVLFKAPNSQRSPLGEVRLCSTTH